MALYLNDPEFLEALWDTAPKASDNRVHYTAEDVDTLWHSGFIDTKRVTLQEWRNIMSAFKQADGTYALDHDQFRSLDPYRYKGEIKIPFDPMLIHEGRYTDKSFDELVTDSIAPSCNLSEEDLNTFVARLKAKMRDSEGLLNVDKTVKLEIKQLIDGNPSPLRRFEIMLDYIFSIAEQYLKEEGIDIKAIASATQRSMFSKQATSETEQKAMDLKNLMKARKTTGTVSTHDAGEKLGKLKRSKRGMRG